MRRLLLAALLLVATILLATQFGRLESFAAVLRQGDAGWLALAFGAQALWQIAQAAQFQASHRAVGLPLSFSGVLPPVLANNFALVAVPTGSLSTFALFAANAQRRGLSPARASVAVIVFAVFNYLVLAVFAAIAAALLAQRGQLSVLVSLPVLVVCALALAQYAVLLFALAAPARFEQAAGTMAEILNRVAQRVVQRDLIAPDRIAGLMAEAGDGLTELRRQGPLPHLGVFALGLVAKLLQLSLFALVLRAFGQPASLDLVITGATLAAVFTVLSPTPVGVGITEGGLALVLTQFGRPFEIALVVALAYRALNLWWPFLYGFAVFQLTGLSLLRRPTPEQAVDHQPPS
jgi:glycosyltransferase 2 family protein